MYQGCQTSIEMLKSTHAHTHTRLPCILDVHYCGFRSIPGESWNCILYVEGQVSPEKENDHSRLVGRGYKNSGDLLMRLVLGHCTSRSKYLPARILNLYRGLNRTHLTIPSRQSLQHIVLLRPPPWKWLPLWEQWTECTFQGQRSGWRASNCQGLVWGSNSMTPQWPPPTITSVLHKQRQIWCEYNWWI